MKTVPKIEVVYRRAEELAKIVGEKHGMSKNDTNELRDDIISLLVDTNNIVVKEVKSTVLGDVYKVLNKHGYQKFDD